MRKLLLLACSCALLVPFASVAQSSNSTGTTADKVPSFVAAGMQAYKDKGPEEAVRTWIKGSPIDGSKEALSQADNLRRIQEFYGAYNSFELLNTRDLGSRTRILYFVVEFEKGPVFAKFVVYRTDQGWILTSFTFNTNEASILPSDS